LVNQVKGTLLPLPCLIVDTSEASSDDYEYSSFEKLVTTSEHIATSTITDVPMTTLCDGKARLLEPYKTITVTSTETLESPAPTTFTLPYTEPEPTCTIAESACKTILSDHRPDYKGFCTSTKPDVPCTSDASQSCRLYNGDSSKTSPSCFLDTYIHR
jgi:hypothetical protein